MRREIPMLLMLIAPYAVLAVAFIGDFSWVPIVWIAVVLTVYLPNMAYAFALPSLGYGARRLLFWNMLLKLCHIPVYCAVFFVGLMMGVFVIPILPFVVLFDYLLLLTSTMYGISGMRMARRAHRLSAGVWILNIAMQFMFCLDVFSAVYLYVFPGRRVQDEGRNPPCVV